MIKFILVQQWCRESPVGFVTVSVEHEVVEKLDLKEIVAEFSTVKARKSVF